MARYFGLRRSGVAGVGPRRWGQAAGVGRGRFLVLLIEYVCSCSFDFFTDMIGHPTKSPGVCPTAQLQSLSCLSFSTCELDYIWSTNVRMFQPNPTSFLTKKRQNFRSKEKTKADTFHNIVLSPFFLFYNFSLALILVSR